MLGVKAESNRPEITQIIFKSNNNNLNGEELERNLFAVRKKIEKKSNIQNLKDFYICSFSSRSIIYKGMFLAETLSEFYPDLLDKRFVSKFAIFHQRYSTNTFPSWDLAQPFKTLAHNGEINTLKGNINWMKIHERNISSEFFDDVESLKPVIASGNSDSAALDKVFEFLIRSGKSIPLVKLMLIPDAWSKRRKTVPKTHQHLFNFLNSTIEPWDGPAAIAATDGKWIIAATDRNGLRPLRYTLSADRLLFAGSETGMVQIPNDKVISKGRLGPGQIIAINLEQGKVYNNKSIKDYISKDYKKYNKQIVDLDKKFSILKESFIYSGNDLRRRQYLAGINIEDLELILHPMVEEAKEAVGSMGDDTPVAVLSDRYRPLSNFFRQNFSQVTNPPIDSLRENEVMSLKTRFGNLGNILDFENLTKDNIYVLESPILSNSQFKKFTTFFKNSSQVLDCTFDIEKNLKKGLNELSLEAEIAVREGCKHLILSDKKISKKKAAIPMILALGAINSKLVNLGIRGFVSISVQTAEVLDTHSFAVLLGIGATIINPYLVFDSIYQRFEKKSFGNYTYEKCIQQYIRSIDNGLLKIMSKMGISVLSSYRGGCNFETVGLSRAIVAQYLPGMISRISGIGIFGIEKKIKELHKKAFQKNISILPIGGIYKYRKNGENHHYQGHLIHMLQHAVTTNSYETYKKYTHGIYNLPTINLRDLLAFKNLGKRVDINEIESVDSLR